MVQEDGSDEERVVGEENKWLENKFFMFIIGIIVGAIIITGVLFLYFDGNYDIIKKSSIEAGEMNIILQKIPYCNKAWSNPCWLLQKEVLNNKVLSENDVVEVGISDQIKIVFHKLKQDIQAKAVINEEL